MSKLISVYDDEESLNNVMSALTLDIDEVFFVYHHDTNKDDLYNVEKVLKRNKDIKIHFNCIHDDEIQLNRIIDDNPDIIIEVSAVKYLSLFLFEIGLKKNKQIVYFDDEENCIKDYKTHSVITDDLYRLDIEDVVYLRGGKIVSTMHRPIEDVEAREAINQLAEENITNYSAFIKVIQRLNSILSNSRRITSLKYETSEENIRYIKTNSRITRKLIDIEGNTFTIRNKELKKTIEISGTFLEQYIFNKLTECRLFDDVMMSVVIDFANNKTKETVRCEIDNMVISNNKLLFVSCKSNKAGTDSLNEIHVHNHMFGNSMSEPVLVIVEDLSKQSPSIYAKGKELGVKIIDNTDFVNNTIVDKFNDIFNGKYEYEKD